MLEIKHREAKIRPSLKPILDETAVLECHGSWEGGSRVMRQIGGDATMADQARIPHAGHGIIKHASVLMPPERRGDALPGQDVAQFLAQDGPDGGRILIGAA